MLGRAFHLVIDALLVSVVLSGIKRNTGLTLSLSKIPNRDLRHLVRGYLEAGEWVRGGCSRCGAYADPGSLWTLPW